MCEIEIDRLHINNKKNVYKGRKETTHVEVGERNIHPHIKKNKYNVCVKTVTKPNVQECSPDTTLWKMYQGEHPCAVAGP